MKKTVWLNVSIGFNVDDDIDDESVFEFANDIAVEAGFVVDDMGMVEEAK